jgi:predicted alpha/beta hydrolase
VELRALDGHRLGAVFHEAPGAGAPRRAAVIHCGAGIPAAYYRHFATYLAEAGIPTLTYDYRGIGASRPVSLRGFRATVEDWGQYDCGGAIAWLRERYPRSQIIGVAHSVGALLHGGAQNAGEQALLALVCPHTGYYGDYRAAYRLPMAALWHGIMPVLTRLFGYFPARRLGLGDDIPAEIALQWAGRRSAELRPAGAGAAHARTRMLLDRCAALARPGVLVSIGDDAFATAAAAERLLAYYPRMPVSQRLSFTPADARVRGIGHFGFFRRDAGALLWPRLLAALQALPTAPPLS